jgi:hypothetical protein
MESCASSELANADTRVPHCFYRSMTNAPRALSPSGEKRYPRNGESRLGDPAAFKENP